MIRARLEGMTLRVRGHAGVAPDLVCAAVTGLVYALAQRLTEWDARDGLKETPVIKLESGKTIIEAVPKRAYAARVREDFRMTLSGLKFLAQHYPEQIKVD